MKMLSRTLLLMLALSALVAWGCSDDEEEGNGTDTIQTDTAGGDTNTNTDTAQPTPACTNAADFAAAQAVIAGGSSMLAEASTCGQGCIGNADERQCTIDCLAPTNISAACGGCIGDTVLCAINECLMECIDTSTPDKQTACDTCRVDKGCVGPYVVCSGLEPSCENAVDENQDGTTDCDDAGCQAFSTACQ